jgi:hypothetical protein
MIPMTNKRRWPGGLGSKLTLCRETLHFSGAGIKGVGSCNCRCGAIAVTVATVYRKKKANNAVSCDARKVSTWHGSQS